MELQEIEEKLKTVLKPSRYRHTLGVAYTAACMAMVFDVDTKKAYKAGLLHDCAKGFSIEKQRQLCQKYHIDLEGTLTESPQLMHQEIAPFLAKDEYEETDNEILSAIGCHTTGKIAMTALEDLDRCTEEILKNTIDYLTECGQKIDERTIKTYEYYKAKKEN